MKEQITYLELLKRIEDKDNIPFKIGFNDKIYEWDIDDLTYYHDRTDYLESDLDLSTFGLAHEKIIEIISSEEDSEYEKVKNILWSNYEKMSVIDKELLFISTFNRLIDNQEKLIKSLEGKE